MAAKLIRGIPALLMAEMLTWTFNIPLSNAVIPPIRQGGAGYIAFFLMLLLLFFFIIVLGIILHRIRKRRGRLLSQKGVKIAAAIGVAIIAVVIVVVVYAFLFSPTKPRWHSGDLVIGSNETLTIQSCVYTQDGDIIVKDNASLVIKEATLIFDQATRQRSLTIMDDGTLEMEKATVKVSTMYGAIPELDFSIRNHARATIKETLISSPIHCYDSSQISVYNSTVQIIDHRTNDG